MSDLGDFLTDKFWMKLAEWGARVAVYAMQKRFRG